MANLGSMAMLAALDGAIAIDKPSGIAAHDAERAVRARFNLAKTGHGATLDPAASGVFVILLGDATRLAANLLGADSTYECKMRLGRETDTGDLHGRTVAEKGTDGISRERLEAAMAEFRGDIYQSPPEASAVRIAGRPDWEIVPTGKGGAEKLVHVYRLSLASFEPPFASFSLVCAKGVSPRALVRDIGRALGCGASVEELRRVKCGAFAVDGAIPLMELLKLDAVGFKSRCVPPFEAAGR